RLAHHRPTERREEELAVFHQPQTDRRGDDGQRQQQAEHPRDDRAHESKEWKMPENVAECSHPALPRCPPPPFDRRKVTNGSGLDLPFHGTRTAGAEEGAEAGNRAYCPDTRRPP